MSARAADPAPDSIDALISLASAGQWVDLERSARQLLESNPQTAFLWKALGLARWNQGRSALDALRRAAALAPEDPEIQSNLGQAWLEAGENELAAQHCRAAISLKPELAEAHANLGNTLRALGRLPEAAASYREACRLRPRFAEGLSNLAGVLRSQGLAADAVDHCRQALQLKPNLVAAHCNLGNALRDLGQTDAAIAAYARALELDPDFTEAHSNLGHAQLHLREFDAALESYRRVIALKPRDADAHNNAGNALRLLGRFREAVESCRRALDLNPGLAATHANLGNGLFSLGRLDEAVASYRRALELKPDAADIHTHLGHAQLRLWRIDEATVSYRRALEIHADHPAALIGLASTLIERGALAAAEQHLRRAIELDATAIEGHGGLAQVLRLLGRARDAEASCRHSLNLDPAHSPAHVLLAELCADRGDFAQAQEHLRAVLAIEPDCAPAWAGLAQIRKMQHSDTQWLASAQALAEQSPARLEVPLRFALGKYFDDVGDYDQAFDHFLRANELARRHRGEHDAAAEDRLIDALISHYDAAWFERPHPHAEPSRRPIFVVGMQRSGTTLTEQTIAAHADVFGAGELRYWGTTLHDAGGADIDAEERELGAKARGFLDLLASLDADAPRVVEKTCVNYLNLGAIHAALPNARIICVTRHPIDNCLSIFTHNYASGHNWANSLESLSHHYRAFRRIMRHWRAHLPAGVMLEVPYERLVQDHEQWSRRMLEFLDLPWDPRCLRFHDNDASIRNFSRWQVRQKVTQTSVDRWRRYEKHLGPWLSLLDEAGNAGGSWGVTS